MKKRLLAIVLAATAAPALAHNGVPHEPGLPKATTDQIHQVAAAVERYRDFEVAKREGWTKFGGDEPLMGEHWSHKNGPDYIAGDPLDFTRPSNLMYTEIGGKKVLTGVAFVVRLGDGELVPEGFAGSADKWHVHDFVRAVEAALSDRPFLRWLANGWLDQNYRNKGDNRGRLAMAHVWVTIPNPDGIFADHNRAIPYLKLGLPASHAKGASMAAAQGLNMATTRGCGELIDGRLWIANASKAVSRALHKQCRAEAATIRAALSAAPAELNRVAAQAYARFEANWNRSLTPAQRARIAAMTEHGSEHHPGEHHH